MSPTETRSYIVFHDKLKGYQVKESHWVAGYTPAHCATPEEAVRHELDRIAQDIARLTHQFNLIKELEHAHV